MKPNQPDKPEMEVHFWDPECPAPLRSKTGERYFHRTLDQKTRLRRLYLRGEKIPEGAVYVGRNRSLGGGLITDGIHYGNPFALSPQISKRAKTYHGLEESGSNEYWALHTPFIFVTMHFCHALNTDFLLQERIKRELRGKNLVCHCHPDLCCHGNVLLKVANADGPVYCEEYHGVIGYEDPYILDKPSIKEAFAYGLKLRQARLPYRPGLGWPAWTRENTPENL